MEQQTILPPMEALPSNLRMHLKYRDPIYLELYHWVRYQGGGAAQGALIRKNGAVDTFADSGIPYSEDKATKLFEYLEQNHEDVVAYKIVLPKNLRIEIKNAVTGDYEETGNLNLKSLEDIYADKLTGGPKFFTTDRFNFFLPKRVRAPKVRSTERSLLITMNNGVEIDRPTYCREIKKPTDLQISITAAQDYVRGLGRLYLLCEHSDLLRSLSEYKNRKR